MFVNSEVTGKACIGLEQNIIDTAERRKRLLACVCIVSQHFKQFHCRQLKNKQLNEMSATVSENVAGPGVSYILYPTLSTGLYVAISRDHESSACCIDIKHSRTLYVEHPTHSTGPKVRRSTYVQARRECGVGEGRYPGPATFGGPAVGQKSPDRTRTHYVRIMYVSR